MASWDSLPEDKFLSRMMGFLEDLVPVRQADMEAMLSLRDFVWASTEWLELLYKEGAVTPQQRYEAQEKAMNELAAYREACELAARGRPKTRK
jgi:hypothetical protein